VSDTGGRKVALYSITTSRGLTTSTALQTQQSLKSMSMESTPISSRKPAFVNSSLTFSALTIASVTVSAPLPR